MKTIKTKTAPARVKIKPVEAPAPAQAAEPGVWPKRLLSAAVILLILHGVMELLSALFWFVPSENLPAFVFSEIANNLQLVIWISLVAAALRFVAAVGISRNLKWGWLLGVYISFITFAMLTFYLPMGVVDAVLAGAVLALLVIGRYPDAKISA
jgi:hypothetical protein